MLTLFRALPLALLVMAPADTARAGGSLPVAEIVTFRLLPGIGEAAFVETARALESFLHAEPGFVARRLSRGDDGLWTDHVQWSDLEAAKAAALRVMSHPDAAPFMAAIEPESVSMRHETLRLALPD